MAKQATVWSSNAAKYSSVTTYSSSTATYSSASVYYSNQNAASDEYGHTPQLWAAPAKTAVDWSANPLSTSTDTYDPTGVTYDSIFAAYDGNQDTSQSPIQSKSPTVWSMV